MARCDLLLALGDALARAGDTGAAKESYRRGGGAGGGARADRAPRAGGVRLRRARSSGRSRATTTQLVPLLERAIAALGRGARPRCGSCSWLAWRAARCATPAIRRSARRSSARSPGVGAAHRRPGDPGLRDPRLHPRSSLARAHAGRSSSWAIELVELAAEAGDRSARWRRTRCAWTPTWSSGDIGGGAARPGGDDPAVARAAPALPAVVRAGLPRAVSRCCEASWRTPRRTIEAAREAGRTGADAGAPR